MRVIIDSSLLIALASGDERSPELKSRKAYDAAYLALAEHLQAELWTLDKRLFNNASASGFPIRLLPVG